MTTKLVRKAAAILLISVFVAGCGSESQTAATKSIRSKTEGPSETEADVWVLDGAEFSRTSAKFVSVVDRSATQRAVVYKDLKGATVRLVSSPNMLAQDAATPEPDTKAIGVEAVGTSALTAQQRLGGTAGMTITISGAASIEDARSILSDVEQGAARGANFGFTGDRPDVALGSLQLVGYTAPDHPAATGGEYVQQYSTSEGTSITVRQALASDPESLDLAAVPLVAPISSLNGYESVVEDGGRGAGPSLVTIRGQSILRISGTFTPSILSKVVDKLVPIDRNDWQKLVDSDLKQALEGRASVDFGEGVVTYQEPGKQTIACRSGSESVQARCGWSVSEVPLVVVIPTTEGHLIAGCLDGAVTHADVNGTSVRLVADTCGQKFVTEVSGTEASIVATGIPGLDAPVEYRYQVS